MGHQASREERSLSGRLAVETSWANTTDRSSRTAPGRRAMLAKFEQEIDPYGVLDPEERRRRAEHARRAHMARLSLEAAKARRLKAEQRKGAA